MSFDDKILTNKLKEIAAHYMTAKRHLLFSESYFNKSSLGVLNEFRNSYDHLIRGFMKSDAEELNKSISHLRRAAYDSCEMISMSAIKEIHKKVIKYDSEVISTVFPEYFSEIYPRLESIKQEISKERGANDDLFKSDKHLDTYNGLCNELIDFDQRTAKAIVGMEEYNKKVKSEKNKSERNSFLKSILIAIIAGLVVAIASYFIFLNKSNNLPKADKVEISK